MADGRPAPPPAIETHLPQPGRLVSVGLEDVGRSWRTRVEQIAGPSMVVVAPTRRLGDAIVPDVGRPVIVGWAATDGYYEAECTFSAAGTDTVVTWTLAVVRVVRLQRRSAFRIDTAGPVTLQVGPRTVEGRLCNVSEGGLCLVVTAAAAPDERARVEVTVELEQLGTFVSAATVVRVSPSAEPGEREVAVAFTGLDETQAESLRQFVFDEQLRRRASLTGG